MTVQTSLLRPDYSLRFRCIGPACEDSCCAGWTIAFDEVSCHKYEALPESPLKVLIEANVRRLPPGEDGSAPVPFAKVQMTSGNACPLLSDDKLCQIQTQLGEPYLSNTCATYPRVSHKPDGLEEYALSLSCPEAARLVLLADNLLAPGSERYQMSWHATEFEAAGSSLKIIHYFWPVREFVIFLLTSRRYDLWQRLFLTGVFARRLDSLKGEASEEAFLNLLGNFKAAVESDLDAGGLQAKMDTISPDLELQLDIVLRLAGMPLPRSHVGARFIEVIELFKAGVGSGAEATLDSLIECYSAAYLKFYLPFFRRHPYILENWVVNAVFRSVFPFGPDVGKPLWKPAMEHQFCLLAGQFALIKGLLIGVAGSRREEFCIEDVVKTIQSASKHFEHHPGFLEQTHTLLTASKLDNLRGSDDADSQLIQ